MAEPEKVKDETGSKEEPVKTEETVAATPAVKVDTKVEIIALAADIEKIPVEKGMTVAEALRKTEGKIKVPKNGKITVNGNNASLETVIKGGDKVVISPKNKNGLD